MKDQEVQIKESIYRQKLIIISVEHKHRITSIIFVTNSQLQNKLAQASHKNRSLMSLRQIALLIKAEPN